MSESKNNNEEYLFFKQQFDQQNKAKQNQIVISVI